MYIKEIIIEGFKSYHRKIVVEKLHQQHNVIVGQNGSGKSNFFSAIEFVLSDEYNNLRSEQRAALINKGLKSRSETAYVEIVLEMSHNAVRWGSTAGSQNIARVRRSIGFTKRDQYMLNGHNVSRKEIKEFLESVGLSNSSPYYIIKQGKINQLAMSQPRQLLDVLFEVAGIRVYNEQLSISMKNLKASEEIFGKTLKERSMLENNLKELAQEKTELEKYEKLDKKQRVLQFKVLEKRQLEASKMLASLDRDNDVWKEKQRKLLEQKIDSLHQIAALKEKLSENQTDVYTLNERKNEILEQHLRLEEQKASLDMTVEAMMDELNGEAERKLHDRAQLEKLNQMIAEREKALQKVSKQCNKFREEEDILISNVMEKEQMRNERMDKTRRGMQFSNQQARDQWLTQEIVTLSEQISSKKGSLRETMTNLELTAEKLANSKKRIQSEKQIFDKLIQDEQSCKSDLADKKKKVQDSIELREFLLKRRYHVQHALVKAEEEVSRLEICMQQQFGKATFQGWKSILKALSMIESEDIRQGYYGRVLEVLQCEENIHRAVQTSAGNRLYHHIVKTDAVANDIIAMCNLHKLPGEFNFMPLNRLQPPVFRYPKDKEITPLISMLQYSNNYEPVVRTIFSKILVCTDLEIASMATRRYGLTCVTPDGDMTRTGIIMGGYHAPRISVMKLHLRWVEANEKLLHFKDKLDDVQNDIKQTDILVSSHEQEILSSEATLLNIQEEISTAVSSRRTLPEKCRKLEEDCTEMESKIRRYRTELDLLERKKNSLSMELNSQLLDELSVDDQVAIQQLDVEIRNMRVQQHKTFEVCLKARGEKSKLENMLHTNLYPKREELVAAHERSDIAQRSKQLQTLKKDQEIFTNKIVHLLRNINETDKRLNEATELDKKISEELENWQQKLKTVENAITDVDPAMISQQAQKHEWEKQCHKYGKKINDLGTLPAIDPIYQTMPLAALTKELEETKKQMNKYGNVNKKATDNYLKLRQRYDKTVKEMEHLRQSRLYIDLNFKDLQKQRTACIQTTFECVNNNFSEIFRAFVPAGYGKLILHTNDDSNVVAHEVDAEYHPDHQDRYVGLGIEVSFNGTEGSLQELRQLSGGQKTIVAIALIFAIQKYNPAPFYLFDEIDQALDSQYRKAVAAMIQQLSEHSQFITITFRRELLEHANKFYGVKYQNRISRIGSVSKQQAYDFVVHDGVD
ncbi:structural maintenance of chromosomes protein 3-like [Anopheles nili]|uniref:structural maintenance of chromosomes protein 3-like n=1 Tax=Anopheles nili TaxID=185578 RepID=UPI00237AFBC8|nr:structural maintenance of chromosomes protein 3-like [Anopheles nili]